MQFVEVVWLGYLELLQRLLQWWYPDAKTWEGCGTGRKRPGCSCQTSHFGHLNRNARLPDCASTSQKTVWKERSAWGTALSLKLAAIWNWAKWMCHWCKKWKGTKPSNVDFCVDLIEVCGLRADKKLAVYFRHSADRVTEFILLPHVGIKSQCQI